MYRIGKEEADAVARVIDSKQLFKINDGLKEVENCEKEMKEIFGTKNALLMTSGKAALISALVGMGIGPGDEVIVPGYTYLATAVAVVAAGAIPVIAEVDETLTLSPEDFERKITPHTKAVIPVHIQGFPCNMEKICEIADKHGIKVLEDACQADGGSFKGKRLGTWGEAGALSFNFFKIISAGEGGVLFTDNSEVWQRALIYHDSSAVSFFGDQLQDVEEDVFCGTEYRSNEITAAILREQLKKMDTILGDLRRIKKTMMDALASDYKFIPSYNIEGDCGTTLAFRFDSEEDARRFAETEGVDGRLPIDTGKHVYTNWTPIMNKKGAFHPLMDPFKMEANKDIIPDYKPDMCPETLKWLSRTVYVDINPDWTDEQIAEKIEILKAAK